MKSQLPVLAAFALLYTFRAGGQNQPADRGSVPIYRVTVIERTVKAVDYQYRSGPTTLDFRGTVLLPKARGTATVESKKGRTEIDARFEHVEAPTRYGPEYLTYVLWAITPEGHPRNLGEVLAGSSDHARLQVTTDLQAFGMIVTAEPYSAVRQPSDVVVMENEIRPDTVGRIEPVQARYELMPRGHYTYNVPSNQQAAALGGPAVSMDRYEETIEVYQAQNAVQIARSMGADRYAPDTFSKAEQLLKNAQENQVRRADKSIVVTAARQAAQTAEDARAIAEKRKQEEDVAHVRDQAVREQALREQAEAEAQRLKAQSSADRMQLDQERFARRAAEAQVEAARTLPPPPQPAPVQAQPTPDARKTELRAAILRNLTTVMDTRDTPRGLVVTVRDADFRGSALSPSAYERLGRVAAMIAAHPGLYARVEGNTDSTGSDSRDEDASYARATAVREALVRSGVPADSTTAFGMGGNRPLTSNATASGREQNRRVEITVSGETIGSAPNWDKPYSLVPAR